MLDPGSAEAVREALEGIEAAVETAAKRRAAIVRGLATTAPPPALATEHRELAEALLRAEAADADALASAPERAVRVLDEQRRSRAARARMAERAQAASETAYVQQVESHCAELEATWVWALDRSDAFAAMLAGRVPGAIEQAVTGYVGAFRAVLLASRAQDRDALARAVSAAERAGAELEQALAG